MASNSRVRSQEVVYTTDPSALTTDAIEREVSVLTTQLQSLKVELQRDLEQRQETRLREQVFQDKLFETKLTGIQETFQTRLAAIDEATELRLAIFERIPDEISDKIGHHEDLQQERFRSIGKQFEERDIRTEQAGKASTEALAAALQAAKELVTAQGEASAAAAIKSETSFTKQIDQIGTIISTLEKALDARITELKERIDRGEGNASGSKETQANASQEAAALILAQLNSRTESRAGNSQMLVIGAMVISFLSLVAGTLIAVFK